MKLFFAIIGVLLLCGSDTPKTGWAFAMLGVVCFCVMLWMDKPNKRISD